MENILVQLRSFVQDSLHPKTLAAQRISSEEFEKWEIFISEEIKQLTLSTIPFRALSGRNKHDAVIGLVEEIIDLSNIVNGYIMRFAKVWQVNPKASSIKSNYLFTCRTFETFLNSLAKKYPGITGKTRYSDYAISMVKLELRTMVNTVEKHLTTLSVGTEIREMLMDSLRQLVNQSPLIRCDYTYINKILTDLMKRQFNNSVELSDFLIIKDFNLPEFFLFCVSAWNEQLSDTEGLYEQKELILDAKAHLYDLSLSGIKNPANKQRLYNELNNFLGENMLC